MSFVRCDPDYHVNFGNLNDFLKILHGKLIVYFVEQWEHDSFYSEFIPILFWNNWINELCIEQCLHIFYYGDPVYKSTSLVLNDNVCTLVITAWFYVYIYQEFTHHRLMEIIYQCMRIQRTFSGNFLSFCILRTIGTVVYKPGEYVKM